MEEQNRLRIQEEERRRVAEHRDRQRREEEADARLLELMNEQEQLEEERQRQEASMRQMQMNGALHFAIQKVKLDSRIREVRQFFDKVRIRFLTDPSVERTLVETWRRAGHEANSITDLENHAIEFWKNLNKGELKRRLKGNPYEYYYPLSW